MPIPEWLFYVGLFTAFIAFVGFIAWLLGSILEEVFASKWRKLFEEDFILALKTSQPSLDQILLIARTRAIKNADVYFILRRQLREVLTGRNKDLSPHRALIETFLSEMDEAEPFEGMPSSIRIHLERLREHSPAIAGLLEPLTTQIRDLLSINEKEKKQQKYYTVGGFFLGIIGLLFAAITYFYPNAASPNTVPMATPAASAPK